MVQIRHTIIDKNLMIAWSRYWNLELWYDNICYTNESEGEENRIQSILLNTNEVLEGNCLQNSNLRIFAKFIQELETMPGLNKITELTKFELKNINITYE